jgi:hypothetical protein
MTTQRKLILFLLVAGLLLSAFFGFRAVRSLMRMPPRGQLEPIRTNVEDIRGWMTLDYISHVYKVPLPYLFEQLNLPADTNPKTSLADLNQKFYSGQPGAILPTIKQIIADFQQNHPTPEGPHQ